MHEETNVSDEHMRCLYDGHTGAFMERLPSFGTKPSMGAWLVDLVGQLHFGTLFGNVTKILWTVFGLLTSALVSAGLFVYLVRQKSVDGTPIRLVRAMAVVLSSGLPLLTAICTAAWAVSMVIGAAEPVFAMTLTFVAGLALLLVLGALAPLKQVVALTSAVAGLILLMIPSLANAGTGATFGEVAVNPLVSYTIAVDIVFWLTGICMWVVAAVVYRRQEKKDRDDPPTEVQQEMIETETSPLIPESATAAD